MMKQQFLKKYPNADMSKFDFFANFDKNGNFIDVKIFFKNNELSNIKSDKFKNDKNMTKYLYSNNVNPTDEKFPKTFQSIGTIQLIPKGKIHKADYPINGKKYLWDEFPVVKFLNYPVNKFKIYVSSEYFH